MATSGRLGQGLRHAAIRAHYRDKPWLDAETELSRDRRKPATREALIYRLQQVRVEHMDRSSRPQKYNRRDAAHGLGTTVRLLLTQAKKFDIPCDLVEEDWTTFRHRALRWAVEKSLADGLSLAPTQIRRLAGVHTVVTIAYVNEVINEVVKKLSTESL